MKTAMKFTTLEKLSEETSPPHVVRVQLCTGHGYLTFAGDCQCDRHKVAYVERFVVAGTAYGCLHNTSGNIRFWRSRSGASHAVKRHFN